MKIHFNNDAFTKSLIVAGFVYFIYSMMVSNQLAMYVNPRFFPLIQASILLLCILLVVQILQIFSHHKHHAACGCSHHNHTWVFIPFLIALFLAFAFSTTSLDAKIVDNKGLNTRLNLNNIPMLSTQSKQDSSAIDSSDYIALNETNFMNVITRMNNKREDYIGKQVEITGFVYREPTMKPSQIAIVRYALVCCSADAAPFGLLCENIDMYKFKANSWLTITGTIVVENYKGAEIPVIKVTSVEPVETPPQNQYVYPQN
jgi:putative membrane protein